MLLEIAPPNSNRIPDGTPFCDVTLTLKQGHHLLCQCCRISDLLSMTRQLPPPPAAAASAVAPIAKAPSSPRIRQHHSAKKKSPPSAAAAAPTRPVGAGLARARARVECN